MKVFKHIIICVSLFNAVCVSAQNSIKKLQVEEIGYHFETKIFPEVDEINHNGLNLKITPISATELNSKFFSEDIIDGRYEYSTYDKSRISFFIKRNRRKLRVKTDYEFFIEGVEWLLNNNKIDSDEYERFVDDIDFMYETNDKLVYESNNNTVACNPYYVGDKYLNVFKIDITNETDSFKELNGDFCIQSEDVVIPVLSYQDIINKLSMSAQLNQSKIFVLQKYDLTSSSLIPPNSSCTKYFSTAPINLNKELIISYSGIKNQFRWFVQKQQNVIKSKYDYYSLKLNWHFGDVIDDCYDVYYLVKSECDTYMSKENLFISKENLDKEFEVVVVSVYKDGFYFGRNKIVGNQYLDLKKGRRKTIDLFSYELRFLRKKVKKI